MISNTNLFIKIAQKVGIDKAIAYSSGAKIVQGLTGVLSVFFIAAFLTGEEQGFYYTFGSILALQTFFELGFTGIMTQYVAHEAAHLKLNSNCYYEGEEKYASRLAYLTRFCIKWYAVIAVLFFLVIIIVGFVYFNKFDSTGGEVSWSIPWVILSIGTSINLLIAPFNSLLLGLGKVKEMNRIVFLQQIVHPIILWAGLAVGLKLYVVGINSLCMAAIWIVSVACSDSLKIIINLLKVKVTETISYFKEIFPYQWKIAISWISGYFIFQLFNPVLFATEGAVVAGQMGMTMAALSAIQSLSYSWMNTKVPLFSGLIAMKDYVKLDCIFNRTMKQMLFVCLSLLMALFCFVFLLDYFKIEFRGNILSERFLTFIPMLLMAIPIVTNVLVNSWAIYLRCHKQEPFLWNSVVVAALCCLSTFLLGNRYGLYGITIGYCCIRLFVSLPWGYFTFITKKKEWHESSK